MFIVRRCDAFCKHAHFWGNGGDFADLVALMWAAWAQLVLPKNNKTSNRGI
jgi:hypothetical protein